jgi:hypothetical protein
MNLTYLAFFALVSNKKLIFLANIFFITLGVMFTTQHNTTKHNTSKKNITQQNTTQL